MRTDVKVGLVCVFAVVLAVVCYFTLHDKNRAVVSTGVTNSSAAADAGSASSGSLNLSAPPATAPAAAANDIASTPTFASNTSGGSLLGPSPAYGQVSPPNNNLSGTIILPPGAATAPSSPTASTPSGGSTIGLSSPGSMNAPLTPSPGLTAPGGLSSPGLGSPGLSTAPMSPSSPAESSSILPPATPFSTPNTLTTGTTGMPGTSGKSTKTGKNSKTKKGAPTIDVMTPSSGSTVDILSGNSTSASALLGTGGSYAIQKGDTLGALAKRNGVTVKAMLAANPGVNPNRLKVGQKVTIPTPSATPATEPASSNRTATTRGSAKSKKAKSATTHPAASAGGSYTVKKGDTLRKIAKSVYGDESLWQRIFRANRGDLSSPNDITVGEVIKLPSTK
jgi:LysM repeat protein